MRIKQMTGLLALASILLFNTALADGGFDYIAIKGPGIIGEIDVTQAALTGDYFAFADFSQGEIPPPAQAGQGYQIVRLYVEFVDDKPRDLPFDELHYYPYTGYVYYDGVVDGTSEYDGKWYAANPAAEAPFRSVLFQRALLAWVPFAALVVILLWFAFAYTRKPK